VSTQNCAVIQDGYFLRKGVPDPIDWAIYYATELRWYVFPLRHNQKFGYRGCPGENSTNDPDKIRKIWSRDPLAGIGLDCGRSKVFVVDVDCKDGAQGWESLARLEQEKGPLPRGWRSRTANGGLHIILPDPHGVCGGTASMIAPGIDTRGVGGLIVLPPSIVWLDKDDHAKGLGTYRWL
jgi:hypothetical protein